MMAFFWRTEQWLTGRLLGTRWEGDICMACHKRHSFGVGCPWSCPKDTKE